MASTIIFTKWQVYAFIALFLLRTSISTVEGPHPPTYVPPDHDHGSSAEIWFLNESQALVEKPTSLLVTTTDGDVNMLHEHSVNALAPRWSFSSGSPLLSFHWLYEDGSFENGSKVGTGISAQTAEGTLLVEEADDSLYVKGEYGEAEKLRISLKDLREGTVYVREGEIIQIDRQTTVFLLDAETGEIIRELGRDNLSEYYFQDERRSLFVVRTDYIAKASNLSGGSLWHLKYGEIGTLVTGQKTPATDMASLQLLPVLPPPRSGEPFQIPSSLIRRSIKVPPGLALPEIQYRPGAERPLSLPASSPHLALPSSSHWDGVQAHSQLGPSDDAKGHPHKPESSFPSFRMQVEAFSPVSAVVVVILVISIVVIFIGLHSMTPRVKKQVPGTTNATPKKKKNRKTVAKEQEPPLSKGAVVVAATSGKVNINNGVRARSQPDYGPGIQVGRLFVTKTMIGSGSHGTLVLEGYLDDRKVAVKRLLGQYYEKAQKEIAHLIASDEHPNVVRYYAMEETHDFVYVALERCSFSLYDLILAQASKGGSKMAVQVKESLAGKGLRFRSVEDIRLWDEKGRPSAELFQIMKDVVAGLAHLHALGIVHRDLKPHNVLISSGRIMQAKIADMGLSKQLDDDASSFDTHLTAYGSSGSRGWQAPEQLLKGRASRAVDLFSLGCVLFHCITGGSHPFGSHFDRDRNITLGKMDLFSIVDFPEAMDLIERLLDPCPQKRLPAQDVLRHPLFWDAEKRLAFLKDVSDRVELEIKDQSSTLMGELESLEPYVLCGGWDSKLDQALLQNIRGYRRYNFHSVRDLLRVVRNKANHFRELDEELQELLGPVPGGLDEYFGSRFPRLLIDIYQVIAQHCRGEAFWERYIPASYTPKISTQEMQ
ncbi:hypothetical protein R1sor_012953 [Riccia sorocarpa]|uniref:non-specific serine/threonine protein kinase n=1 Tax=Riccia sorocarpa TaxID=122646 RepID=A0ABD3I994_9MARC